MWSKALLRCLTLLVLAGCGPNELTVTFQSSDERSERRVPGVTWTLDGHGPVGIGVGATYEFSDGDPQRDRVYELEAWYEDSRLDRFELELSACIDERDDGTAFVQVCLLDGGRLGSYCLTGGFVRCMDRDPCMGGIGRCEPDQRCGRVVKRFDPMFAHYECMEDGTVGLDGACTIGPPGIETGTDDCRDGSTCIDGRCAKRCNPAIGGCFAGQSCTDVEGAGFVCMPDPQPVPAGAGEDLLRFDPPQR